MHEMSIVQALLEQVQVEVERSGHPGRVVSLDLVIGRMSGVHVDSVRFAFELLAPGTIAEGASLQIEEPKPIFRCLSCGQTGEIDELLRECPACQDSNITISGGQDLLLQSIELEDGS